MAVTFKASEDGLRHVDSARKSKGWNKHAPIWCESAQISAATLKRFWRQKAIQREAFIDICEALDLRWQDVIDPSSTEITLLVEQIRSKVKFVFELGYKTSSQLQQNLWLKNNFIEPNLVEVDSLPSDYPVGDPDILVASAKSDEDFDRIGVQLLRREATTGGDALVNFPHLFVYGEPGSGKSGYLRWAAMKCRDGEILEDYVPIFIGSRQLAVTSKSETLLTYIEKMFEQCDISTDALYEILNKGRAIFIFDGIDEAPASEQERIAIMIDSLLQEYYDCRFIFSSRLGSTFSFSAELQKVIIAPLKKNQIEEFITYWFSQPGKEPNLAQDMVHKLGFTACSGIRELAGRPVLLELLCIVFEGTKDFPRRRFDIFKNGIQRMTRENVQVKTDIPQLSVLNGLHVENILGIVASYFLLDSKQNIFPTRGVERIIQEYFHKSLSIDKTLVPSKEILRAIEQYNGLLVRWADNYCSFSHLTYQEYFAAEYLVDSDRYKEVLNYLHDPQLRFFVGLTAEYVPQDLCKQFFSDFKRKIDLEIIEDKNLDKFIRDVDSIAKSTANCIKSKQPNLLTYLRAWYFVYALKDVGRITNSGSKNRYFDLPDFEHATSMIDYKELSFHSIIYKIYHEFLRETITTASLIGYLTRMERLLRDNHKTREVISGWLRLVDKKMAETQNGWKVKLEVRWRNKIVNFMETLKLPCVFSFTNDQRESLNTYYALTKFLSTCMLRSWLNDVERQELADSMLRIGVAKALM
ncbi:MAG: NACHT domain-containing protein [Bacteroidota bacterium]